MYRYKIDVLKEIQKRGYTQKELREKKILQGGTITNLGKKGTGNINLESLNNICILLRCQPNDVIEIVASDEEKIKFFK